VTESPSRPLPELDDPVVGPFWASARERRLVFQRCEHCGHLRWPPEAGCPECLTPGGTWTEVEGAGEVWSFVIYDHPFDPAFRGEIPYNVALVQLDAGPRLITNIVGVKSDELRVGMRVVVEFENVTPAVTLVRFRPVGEAYAGLPAR